MWSGIIAWIFHLPHDTMHVSICDAKQLANNTILIALCSDFNQNRSYIEILIIIMMMNMMITVAVWVVAKVPIGRYHHSFV